jgi:maltooligosyltrehalose trehalohydrolase
MEPSLLLPNLDHFPGLSSLFASLAGGPQGGDGEAGAEAPSIPEAWPDALTSLPADLLLSLPLADGEGPAAGGGEQVPGDGVMAAGGGQQVPGDGVMAAGGGQQVPGDGVMAAGGGEQVPGDGVMAAGGGEQVPGDGVTAAAAMAAAEALQAPAAPLPAAEGSGDGDRGGAAGGGGAAGAIDQGLMAEVRGLFARAVRQEVPFSEVERFLQQHELVAGAAQQAEQAEHAQGIGDAST